MASLSNLCPKLPWNLLEIKSKISRKNSSLHYFDDVSVFKWRKTAKYIISLKGKLVTKNTVFIQCYAKYTTVIADGDTHTVTSIEALNRTGVVQYISKTVNPPSRVPSGFNENLADILLPKIDKRCIICVPHC